LLGQAEVFEEQRVGDSDVVERRFLLQLALRAFVGERAAASAWLVNRERRPMLIRCRGYYRFPGGHAPAHVSRRLGLRFRR